MPPNYIKDGKKRCNGPLHKGSFVPLSYFYVFKSGKRKGKPFSRCKSCLAVGKFGDAVHGLVPYSRVNFIFDELEARIGKAETCRSLGISQNFWMRRRNKTYKHIRKATVARAIHLLRVLRQKEIAIHRNSIKHGARMRGHNVKSAKKAYIRAGGKPSKALML